MSHMNEYDYADVSAMPQDYAPREETPVSWGNRATHAPSAPPIHESVDVRLGYAFVPRQIANDRNLYMPEMGLEQGTIFPDLDKRLGVYGEQNLGEGCC